MEVFIRKKKLCLKTIASAAGWDFSRLPSSNTDFRLVSHHNHISQFREIYVYFPTGYVFSGLSVSLFLAGTNPEEKTGNWNPQKRPSRRSLKTKWKQASAHVRTPEKSEEAKKGKKRKKKKNKKHLIKASKEWEVFADIMWSRGILGMEGAFLSPISWR